MAEIQLDGFCDTSERAYAGVVYIQATDMEGIADISLVVAKTRVAPFKRITIPRLELSGALVMARFLRRTSKVLSFSTVKTYAWIDSRVVIGLLRSYPRRFKVFVENLVSEILDLTPPNLWRHVSSKDNPSDCSSLGLYPNQLANHSQWWNGPDWLKQPENLWPISSYEPTLDSSEERNMDSSCVVLRTGNQEDALPLVQRTSSYSRLIRITAWIFRFIHNARNQTRRDGALYTEELTLAERFWLREAQRSKFSTELDFLRKHKPLPRSSGIIPFRPFIDEQELLRVGGRMELSRLSYAKRHPVLLPRDRRVVELLITHEHIRFLHAGATLVCASLAQRLCTLRGRRAILAKIRSCVTC